MTARPGGTLGLVSARCRLIVESFMKAQKSGPDEV